MTSVIAECGVLAVTVVNNTGVGVSLVWMRWSLETGIHGPMHFQENIRVAFSVIIAWE